MRKDIEKEKKKRQWELTGVATTLDKHKVGTHIRP